jgi:hypothetical protein
MEQREDTDLEPWEETYLNKVNTLRIQKGKKPFRLGNKRFNRTTNVTCRYCNIRGHFQKDCRRRLRDGKPQVDAQGKPYLHENKVNPLKEEEEQFETDDDLHGYNRNVSALSYYGINSIRRQHLN